MGADPRLKSQVSAKEQESNLEVAARWNFAEVAQCLVRRGGDWSKKELRVLRASSSKAVRALGKAKKGPGGGKGGKASCF